MDESNSITVVIRCRNEEAHIGRLLTGLVRQSRRPDEIIIVDSGSTDATLSIASAFPVRVVSIAQEDFSFGAACNVGCEAAAGDFVVFVSAHCYPVYDSWIARLIDPFESEDIALSYGRQVGPADGRYSEKRLFSRWFPAESERRQRHPFCNNANAAIRRAVWEDGIRYDDQLTGLEDLDWAKRALAAGHLLSYAADAPVVHIHNESVGQVVNRYRREAIAHRQIDDEQMIGMATAIRLAIANVVQDLGAAKGEGEMTRQAVDIAKFRVAQFYGTYRGFAQHGPVTSILRERFFFPGQPVASPAESLPTERPIDYEDPFDPAEHL